MTTGKQVERILFYNLIDRAQGHSFALMTSTSARYLQGENEFRHRSLIGRLKKRGYEVYDFRARIEDSCGNLDETRMHVAFVIDFGSSWEVFEESLAAVIDKFQEGRLYCVKPDCKVSCHEELGEKHRVFLSRKSTDKYELYRHEYTIGDEIIIGWPMVIEGTIKDWPKQYCCLLDACGYDTRRHWREAYEEWNGRRVKRTAREQISLDTEFHDGALIGIWPWPDEPDRVLRQEISLRAFLRSHCSTWSHKLVKSHFKYPYGSEKLPINLWYVCDVDNTDALLPALYEHAKFIGLSSFLWISAGKTVDLINVFNPLPEFISRKEALVILENQNQITKNISGGPLQHPKKIPHKLETFYLGDQFTQDNRPEIHGIAANQSRYLKDKRLASMEWESIELTEENKK